MTQSDTTNHKKGSITQNQSILPTDHPQPSHSARKKLKTTNIYPLLPTNYPQQPTSTQKNPKTTHNHPLLATNHPRGPTAIHTKKGNDSHLSSNISMFSTTTHCSPENWQNKRQ